MSGDGSGGSTRILSNEPHAYENCTSLCLMAINWSVVRGACYLDHFLDAGQPLGWASCWVHCTSHPPDRDPLLSNRTMGNAGLERRKHRTRVDGRSLGRQHDILKHAGDQLVAVVLDVFCALRVAARRR